MMSGPQSVERQVGQLRSKLLDLTLRNQMLNLRPSKRYGIEVLEEESLHVHRILVEEGKKMSFVGKPDPKGKPGRAEELLFAEDPTSMAEHEESARAELEAYLDYPLSTVDVTDNRLNCSEFESVLPAKLGAIRRQAKLAEEELGINTLFLCLGMLEWRETEAKPLRAPLLFVPVNLTQTERGQVRIEHDGGDVGCNLPLRAKLQEHGFRLPEYTDDRPILDYFAEVATIINSKTDWQVVPNAIVLGFFNYEKYAMYMDLGGEAWPEDSKPWQHADLVAMLGSGYSSTESEIGDHTHLDSVRSIEEAHEVYDADSSQTLAIIRANAGGSMVIEGPPGTGKSQTITNIIAEAVANGKTVLFVSAKRAALEVVKRRLNEADLGAMCLDLHDKMTNRREFYAEIKRTVTRSVSVKAEVERLSRLQELRDRLNAHAEGINEVLPEFGTSPFLAMSYVAALPQETPEDRAGRIDFEALRRFKSEDIRAALPSVAALQARLEQTGVPSQHPFWGAQIDYLDPATRLDLEQEFATTIAKIGEAEAALSEILESLKLDISPSPRNVLVMNECVRQALAAPPHDGVAMRVDTWRAQEATIQQVADSLELVRSTRSRLSGQVKPEIWATDLLAIESGFDRFADKWYRFIVGDFRRAKSGLALYLTNPSMPVGEQAKLVNDVRAVQSAERSVTEVQGAMQNLMGVQWQGLATDPQTLRRLLSWVLSLGEKVDAGAIPSGLLDFFAGNTNDPTLASKAEAATSLVNDAVAAFDQCAAILKLDLPDRGEFPLPNLREKVEKWSENLNKLTQFIAMNEARRQVVERGLGEVASLADRWPLASSRLLDSLQRSYYSGVLQAAISERPALKSFERKGHEGAIQEFQRLDDFKLQYNRGRVRLAHERNKPSFDNAHGNLLLLNQQCQLTRKHKPIRWAMARAGEAIQKIKPVFMMSPLSVSIHLPPELPKFDLVVFDEASQIKPEDALSSIIRAKQAIVVGDTRQMPPSSFFDRIVDEEDEETDGTVEEELGAEAKKLESVLSLMSAVAIGKSRRPDLRWHYRSLHPALIQPSNEMFYDNRLVIFPSPGTDLGGRRIGVVFHHHPETVYEAGSQRRFNPAEAVLVADAVLRHVQERPSESLMVAAMNKQQADLIFNEVSKRERMHPEPFANYRAANPHEPLDVKNLENVQGDERDVIFISITYGRDKSGAILQRFGPILSDGGERRLNVLVTRARIRCEVFSNLTADDIRSTGSLGLECLKRYLKFAAIGSLDVHSPTGGAEESPFEEEVSEALRNRGYEVHAQIGVEKFRIDLAVVDPDHPGSYLLGIECDGAMYHSARSARDRDKLRQRVLESRGWRLHRIWSTDWWQDRELELHRLIEAIESAAADHPEPESPIEQEPEYQPTVMEAPPIASTVTRPYVALENCEVEVGQYLLSVVATEGPIHRDLVKMRLRNALGFGRAGAKVEEQMTPYLAKLFKLVQVDGDAIFVSPEQLTTPRDWTSRPATERKFELVTQVELGAAILAVVKRSFGLNAESVPRAAWNLMGFRRITPLAESLAMQALTSLMESGKVSQGPDGSLRA